MGIAVGAGAAGGSDDYVEIDAMVDADLKIGSDSKHILDAHQDTVVTDRGVWWYLDEKVGRTHPETIERNLVTAKVARISVASTVGFVTQFDSYRSGLAEGLIVGLAVGGGS